MNIERKMIEGYKTHDVFNQPPPLEDYNLYLTNPILKGCVEQFNASWAHLQLTKFGAQMGSSKVIQWGFLANQFTPALKAFNRFGFRINEVDFHPSWHELMHLAMANRLHNLPWVDQQPYCHSVRAALMMMASEVEFGHLCPISMTFSIYPVLNKQAPKALKDWLGKLLSNEYDARYLPFDKKNGVLCGMAMTEKQGGSDVRANTSWAKSINDTDFLLTGHKWFCSAPMVDAFLVLAQAPKGLSCFFMPRYTPDGQLNNYSIQRLKDKLGNRSNASGEIEFTDAYAVLLGEEGRGVATIIEMVNHTRLDCAIGSTGLLHQATVQAIHHCQNRSAFGKKLINQPIMLNVLADLCLETEAATQLAMRLALAFDNENKSEQEEVFKRIVTPIAKFWICKRTPAMVYEALECLGGAGFIEESILPRLYREAPLNAVWEGSGNVICLDVIRAMQTQSNSLKSVISELELALGINPLLDKFIRDFVKKSSASLLENNEAESRTLVEHMAKLLQASLLTRYSPEYVAEAFVESRLVNNHSLVGTLSSKHNFKEIVNRMWLGV
ncbi:isovaleryl-CoA dehydrogenase [Solitalea lacus]|uniref:isovaleryl-CoA dehydrogenase n=1 Tax=Solitalea lacus TaxID=2911172 RepID=UPI001ED9D6F6|nr:isovaleryl-CoA dehydrogenase [Solitalea lacus]UKJ08062.1 isovaleryl-CoA dehydrogenase [Solitalea lacus]